MVRRVLMWVGKPWAFELRPGLNTLGRNPTNNFRLPDPSVSSFHAEIYLEEGRIRVRDLKSTNGTFIDGRQVEEGEIGVSNSIRLGTVELRLEEVVLQNPAPDNSKSESKTSFLKAANSRCSSHPDSPATYQCVVCAAYHCADCVTVVGHDRTGAMTVCSSCGGQCSPLPGKGGGKPAVERTPERGLLGRITQTLRIPWVK